MRQPEPLPPDIAQLLERAAAVSEPPAAVRDRLRGRLATALASPVTLLRPIAGRRGLLPGRAMVGAFAGFIVGAASMWALRPGAAPAPVVAAPASVAPSAEGSRSGARQADAAASPAPESQAVAAAAPLQALPAVPARILPHRFVRKAIVVAFAAQPAAASTAATATASPSPSHWGLQAEGELLQKGRTAMVRGDTEGALAAVEEHANRFPHGKLVEEREALKIQALVAEDRTPEARIALGAFEREYPRSLLGPALEEAVVGRIQ
jgi:hypothetical protein